MRHLSTALALCAPLASFATTHTIGVDVGRGNTADLACPSAQIPACAHEDTPGASPSGARSTGYSPAFGLNVDFGNKLVRAGLSIDLYPSVGDADYVRHYGVGCEPCAASAVISSRAGTGRVSVATQSRMSM
jgi:hypothetical protein